MYLPCIPMASRIRPGHDVLFPDPGAAAVGILAGAGLHLLAVASCVIVLVILEINRLPIYRRIDPGRARRDEETGGYDPRFGTTALPTTRRGTMSADD